MRAQYTAKEDEHLLKYIAEARPLKAGRQGREIYQTLVANPDAWPWARTHSWQGWRDHYRMNQDEFDERIAKYLRRRKVDPGEQAQLNAPSTHRTGFTDDEDKLLVKYLARYHPQLRGRSGNLIYKKLVENAEGKWNWSKTHSWQSWRSRYISNQDRFDREIAKYQARHNISIPVPSNQVERPAKRLKVTVEDSQEADWAKLDWTSRRDHAPNGTTVRGDEQEEKNLVVVEEEKPVVVIKPTPDRPSLEGIAADEDQADESDDGGGPPASDDYVGEVFPSSDKSEKGDEQVSATEDEDEDADPGTLCLNGTTDALSPNHGEPGSDHSVTVLEISEPKPITKPEPTSPHSLPKPSQSKPRVVPSYNDFTFGSQYKRYHPHPNDDPFEDYQSPPKSQAKLPLVEKSPPKIVEGPFGNRLSRARVRKLEDNPAEAESENDGGTDVPWPPPRGTMSKLRMRKEIQPRKPRGGYLNGTLTEQPRRDKGKGKAREYDESDFSPEVHDRSSPVIYENEPNFQQAIPAPSQPKTIAAQGPLLGPGPSQTSTLKRRRTDIFLRPTTSDVPTPKRYSTGDIVNHPPPPSHQPFVSTNINPPSHSRIINFRQELSSNSNKLVQRASSRSSHTSSSIVPEEDNQLFQQLGIQQAMRMLSEQFGFTEAIVQKLWNQLKSLRLLRDALTEMRDSADRKMNEWIEGASKIESEGGAGTQSPIEFGMFQVAARPRTMATPSFIMTTPGPMRNASSRPSSSKHRGRGRRSGGGTGMKSLEIKPVDAQDVSVAMELEYEPLTGTRAGKYTRLAKMGREDEALEREQRRVSSIALSPRRDLLQEEEQEQGEEHDAERKEVEEIVIETREEDEEVQDEDDIYDIRPDEGEGRDIRDDEQDDHAMEVDYASPDVPVQHPTIPLESADDTQDKEQDSEPENHREDHVVHEKRHQSEEPQSHLESLDEGEQTISSNTESPRIGGAKSTMQTDDERWKEAEPLFRAASRGNVETLKELERTFNPGFLMEWLGSLVVSKQL